MAKRARTRPRAEAAGEVGPRQPCPCGSGKRYKACHGAGGSVAPYVRRPFAELPSECDWVAMREFVPAATASLTLKDASSERAVVACTLLPAAMPAMVRPDGTIWLGLQVQHGFGDPSRDLAYALELALDAEPGTDIQVVTDPGPGSRLQDSLDTGAAFEVDVHDGFDFWIADVEDSTGEIAATLESANDAAAPTGRLASVEAAYWTRLGDREFVRWVLRHDEDAVLDALARLHVADADRLVEGSRLIGSFRAYGLIVPVWELATDTGADALEEPIGQLSARLDEAMAVDKPLSADQRSARNGLTSRQLTIH
ncbi:MAG TPA: DUF5926 family protein [Nocardioidaceae bacterium]|nr:DUF5926 family protein [Nocardioidaceae bacterium]